MKAIKTLVTIVLGSVIITYVLLSYAKYASQTTRAKLSKTSVSQPEKIKIIPNAKLVTTIATGLNVPWALAFLPEGGDLLITERLGDIRILRKNGGLDENSLLTIDEVKQIGEGGLLGMAVHPDYPQKPYVYFYYTYAGSGTQIANRLVRYSLKNEKFSDKAILLDNIPASSNHDGGRIKFGPDGLLYITTGDSEIPSLAQSTKSLAGKILRVTDEGKPALGNAFNTVVYSYGHRNPQGLAWDEGGALWETEHGRSNPTGFDEINLIESGKNYGWPTIQGDEAMPDMVTPKKNSGPTTTWAPSGAAFVGNALFFSGLRGQTLYEAIINNNKVVALTEHFKGKYGRLREVILGPDNMLYITTSNRDGRGTPTKEDDRILKINPKLL